MNFGWGCKKTLGKSDHSQEMDCRPALQGSRTSFLLESNTRCQTSWIPPNLTTVGIPPPPNSWDGAVALPMKIVGWLGAISLHQQTESSGKLEDRASLWNYSLQVQVWDTSQGVRTQVTPEMSKHFCHNVRTLAVPGDNWDADHFRPFTQARHV